MEPELEFDLKEALKQIDEAVERESQQRLSEVILRKEVYGEDWLVKGMDKVKIVDEQNEFPQTKDCEFCRRTLA